MMPCNSASLRGIMTMPQSAWRMASMVHWCDTGDTFMAYGYGLISPRFCSTSPHLAETTTHPTHQHPSNFPVSAQKITLVSRLLRRWLANSNVLPQRLCEPRLILLWKRRSENTKQLHFCYHILSGFSRFAGLWHGNRENDDIGHLAVLFQPSYTRQPHIPVIVDFRTILAVEMQRLDHTLRNTAFAVHKGERNVIILRPYFIIPIQVRKIPLLQHFSQAILHLGLL